MQQLADEAPVHDADPQAEPTTEDPTLDDSTLDEPGRVTRRWSGG